MRRWRFQPARDLGLPLGRRLRSIERESGLVEVIARIGWWTVVRGYLAVAHRLSISGRDNLPEGLPFVLVSNHTSHLDTLTLAATLPRNLWSCVFPIAAGDAFFETPLLDAFAAGMLATDDVARNVLLGLQEEAHQLRARVLLLRVLRARLAREPCGYILFPEGTRSRTGTLARFKPGLGMIVAGTDVPVVPAFIDGAYRALPPGRRLPRPRRIRLRLGPALRFGDVVNDRDGWAIVARRAEAAVRDLAPLGEQAAGP